MRARISFAPFLMRKSRVAVPKASRFLSSTAAATGKGKLAIFGTGWGALRLIRDLDPAAFESVTIISPRDHMLFTPLLASTAVGTLEHRSVIEPVRPMAWQKGFEYLQAEVSQFHNNKAECFAHHEGLGKHTFDVPFDTAVLAVGAVPNTFGVPGVEEHAYFLKEANDGRLVRRRIHDCFEAAELPDVTAEERQKLLTFVVVGGGPTGVEFAAELTDFLQQDLKRVHPSTVKDARVILLEAGSQVLSAFDKTLAEYALKRLSKSACDVRLGLSVKKVTAESVKLSDGSSVPCSLVVWNTGVGARKVVKDSGFNLDDRQQHILVNPHLRAVDTPNIFAIGDCAAVEGEQYAAIAQVAEQQGAYLAKRFNSGKHNDELTPDFHFQSRGMLAYLGSYRGVATLQPGKLKLSGFAAWITWRTAYVTKLGSWRNVLQVPFDWAKTFVFGRDISGF